MAIKSITTDGVVLKRANIQEADRLLTVFTEKAGKLTVKAKGVRRPLSKLAGALDLLYCSNFHLVQGKTTYTLTEVSLRRAYPRIHSELRRTELAFFVAEVITKLTEEGQKQPVVYNLLISSLDFIEGAAELPRQLFAGWFLLNFMAAEGIRPELKLCVFCHRPVEQAPLFWSHAQGGLAHREHAGIDMGAQQIEPNLVKLMRLALGGAMDTVAKIKIDKQLAASFLHLIYDFFQWQTRVELKTIKNI